ncbi:MAG: hypothetical protein O2780_18375, partial [Proteobacteria bacterium]|nr:hypothetical protein [Pseudomonadota bacterium]
LSVPVSGTPWLYREVFPDERSVGPELPYGIRADSKGDLYVSEVTCSGGGRWGMVPLDCHSLQKFVRVRG